MRFKKMYDWKADLRYWILKPKWILMALIGIAKKNHILNDMTVGQYFNLVSCAFCDVQAGRFYIWEED